MLRSVCASRVVVPAGARGICLHSASAPVLSHNAKHRGFKSTVWVEETDEYWFKKVTTVRSGEMATECQAPSRIELYNFDQLLKAPDDAASERHGHYSYKTKKRYSGQFGDKLSEFAEENKFDSKWWLSPAEVRKQGLRVKMGARPCVQLLTRTSKFLNADQFAKPEAIQMQPYSGATGRAYDETVSARLRRHADEIDAESCIYFTARQLDSLQLHKQAGTTPAVVPMSSNIDLTLYPLEAVVNADQFLQQLQRYPVDKPTNVISGKELPEQYMKLAVGVPNKSNYWVSKHDVTTRKFALADSAKGIAPAVEGNSWEAFNTVQLMDPTAAYKKIGLFIPESSSPSN